MGPGIKLLMLQPPCGAIVKFPEILGEKGETIFSRVPGVALFTQLNLIALC